MVISSFRFFASFDFSLGPFAGSSVDAVGDGVAVGLVVGVAVVCGVGVLLSGFVPAAVPVLLPGAAVLFAVES